MSSEMLNKRDILKQIKDGAISAVRGLELLESLKSAVPKTKTVTRANQSDEIAIVGMSGRYPKAPNLERFWQNLKEGKDCITEIPEERWRWQDYFDADPKKAQDGKMYNRWGGFLEDVDRFDPLFFSISPGEAETIDPQERIFMETAWHTLESAGYTRDRLKERCGGSSGTEVGVFVGETTNSYLLWGPELWSRGHKTIPNSFPWSIANRTSYFFDFSGPSLTVDTACSSSLYAIHLACESIRSGECRMAIAGGVNLYLHPMKYVWLCQMTMLSRKGRCHSFGSQADGFCPGEGVGAILLKPLKEAIKDGDRIYGVVKSTFANHDGKTTGYTVPNPEAQANLVGRALEKAGVNAETISYVEAHGTGTNLGDPIEIVGLTNAFAEHTDKKQFCSIGSAKSNIGHLESGAGIAGLTKILLQMKHKMLVPSLHSEQLNPGIDFANSPFTVQQSLEEWKKPVINGEEIPRRAGLSSFGAGGVNVHLIVEDYEQSAAASPTDQPCIVTLSARNFDGLKNYRDSLIEFLERDSEASLTEIAYTLHSCREQMDERMAVVCKDRADLLTKLKTNDTKDSFFGNAKKAKKRKDPQRKENINVEQLINSRDLARLAQLWINGISIPWTELYAEAPSTVELPLYPFAKRKCWIPRVAPETAVEPKRSEGLHPLVTESLSTIDKQLFACRLDAEAFYLADHLVGSEKVLPGVAYLEAARAAAAFSLKKRVGKIKNVVWIKPIIAESGEKEIFVRLNPAKTGLDYKVYSEQDGAEIVHGQGKVLAEEAPSKVAPLDIEDIKARCRSYKDREECYKLFQSMELNYKTGFKGITFLHYNEDEALGKLKLPDSLAEEFNSYLLHPTLMDGALQTVIGLLLGDSKSVNQTNLPFSIGELEIIGPLSKSCWAYASYENRKSKSFNIDICNERGEVAIRIRRFVMRAFKSGGQTTTAGPITGGTPQANPQGLYYYTKEWMPSPSLTAPTFPVPGTTLLFCDNEEILETIKSDGDTILIKKGKQFKELSPTTFEIDHKNYGDYKRLIEALEDRKIMPDRVAHLWQNEKFPGKIDELDETLYSGVYSLFFIVKALKESRHKKRTVVLHGYSSTSVLPTAAVSGFMKTMALENSRYFGKEVNFSGTDSSNIHELLAAELMEADYEEVRYRSGQRFVRRFREVLPEECAVQADFKQGGTYLITGGAGGLGLIFADYLARNYKANLILTGRSKLSEAKEQSLQNLRGHGSEIVYLPADITNDSHVNGLSQTVKKRFGQLTGIIHAAGVLRDSLLMKKKFEEFQQVVTPKVLGTMLLDQYFKDEKLELFMMFASIAGAMGNLGQADYTYGNCFMNDFALWRNGLRAKGERWGKSVALDWPLWDKGGMQIDEQSKIWLKKSSGMVPLRTEYGIKAFKDILALECSSMVVVEGEKEAIEKRLKVTAGSSAMTEKTSIIKEESGSNTGGSVAESLKRVCAELLKVEPNELDEDVEFAEYGVDSIIMISMMNRIEEQFGEAIDPNAITENPTISELAAYLVDEGIAEEVSQVDSGDIQEVEKQLALICAALLKVEPDELDEDVEFAEYGVDSIIMISMMNRIEEDFGEAIDPNAITENPTISELAAYLVGEGIAETAKPVEALKVVTAPTPPPKEKVKVETRSIPKTAPPQGSGRVAVIGMAGRFPGSDNLEQFWKNLREGRNLVGEVPAERWDISRYYSPDKDAPGRSYSKWAGYLNDIYGFDAERFHINDTDAIMMDPHHRMLMEVSLELFDQAGYSKDELSKSRTAVYLGAGESNYIQVNLDKVPDSYMKHIIVNTIPNMMAARIADFYNLKGEALTIDTACSSSLVAIHNASRKIIEGSCEMAVAGGVELLIDQYFHIGFSKSGALSPEDRSYVFDRRAKGFVLGEGCGLILLKDYDRAVADGDKIFGTILGSAVNNDGHTMGLTVPNQEGQKEVIQQALDVSRISPETIGYLEAHGTGTLLGDPIEIKAAGQVYRRYTEQKQFCAVGAVKSNMGHLLRASGAGGVIKLLLSLHNKEIPPTLNCELPHPRFKFAESPFYPNLSLQKWETGGNPRRAAISSFGFGGTNCHMIVEEAPAGYSAKRESLPATTFNRKRYRLGEEVKAIKPEESDKEFYKNLLDRLSKGQLTTEEARKLSQMRAGGSK